MKIKVIFTILSMLVLVSCKKETSYIPEVYVNYHVSIQEFQIKNTNGVLLVKDQGVAGLIIYRAPSGGYLAYDRCSSVEPEKRCAVTIDDNSITATDPCSGAKYLLQDGSPAKAPAVRSLKQYNVSATAYELIVTN